MIKYLCIKHLITIQQVERIRQDEKFRGNYKDHTEDISRIINYLRRSRQDVEREKRSGKIHYQHKKN